MMMMTSKYNKRFAGLVALVGSIGGLLFGYDLGVISGALPSLGIEFGLSIREKELVASIMLVGCVFGSIFGGSICDHIGRKKTIFMVCFLFIISGVILVWSMNLVMLCVGRFIVGIGVSISAIVDISYLTELSRLETRGALVSANELMITIGLLLAYVVDYIFMDKDNGWRWMFGFPVVLAVFWATLMVYMPESPRWLVVQGRYDEALLVLEMIYPSHEEARIEFHNSLDLIESMRSGGGGGGGGGGSGAVVGLGDASGDDIFGGVDAPNSYKNNSNNKSNNKSNNNSNSIRISTNDRLGLDQLETSIGTQQSSLQKQLQENRPNLNHHQQPQRSLYSIIYEWRLSVFSSVVLMILQNFSGHAAVLTYAPEFFASAGYGLHAAAASTVILGVVKVVATIISLALVDKMGRKPILLIGIAGMTISLSAVILILNAGTITEGASGTWLLVAVCVFVASYAIGFGPMTWLISSELFADEYRGRLIGISTIANWCGSLVVVSSFLSLVASIGIVQTLLYYVVMLILSFCFVIFFIPETKQKEILEITRDLSIMFNLSHVLRCGRGGVSNSSYYILDSASAQPFSASSLLQSSSLISSSSSSTSHTMLGSTSSTHPNHFSSNHSSSIGAVSTTMSSHSSSSSIKNPLSLIISDSTKIPLEQKNE